MYENTNNFKTNEVFKINFVLFYITDNKIVPLQENRLQTELLKLHGIASFMRKGIVKCHRKLKERK